MVPVCKRRCTRTLGMHGQRRLFLVVSCDIKSFCVQMNPWVRFLNTFPPYSCWSRSTCLGVLVARILTEKSWRYVCTRTIPGVWLRPWSTKCLKAKTAWSINNCLHYYLHQSHLPNLATSLGMAHASLAIAFGCWINVHLNVGRLFCSSLSVRKSDLAVN